MSFMEVLGGSKKSGRKQIWKCQNHFRVVREVPGYLGGSEILIKGFKPVINVLTINTVKGSKDGMKVIIVLTNQYFSDCHGFQEGHYSYRISLALQACFLSEGTPSVFLSGVNFWNE